MKNTHPEVFRDKRKILLGLDDKTPAEACGIKVEGENKWKTLIQNSSQSKS
jgi:hypothetical protein